MNPDIKKGFVVSVPVLTDAFSIIENHARNPKMDYIAHEDSLGNRVVDTWRHWIGEKIAKMYNVVFAPYDPEMIIDLDLLIHLDNMLGHDPLRLADVEYPQNFSLYFDIHPLTKTTVVIYERQ